MWAWLNGPGKGLREPRPNSTNYLGAYDKNGRLIREADMVSRELNPQDKEASADASTEDERAGDAKAEASEGEKVSRRKGEVPPETIEDLKPFPLNQYFQSEAVLSDELKNEIYKRITQGSTVREVSMALHVEMSRVAAVVRLKTIEQDWLRDVSLSPPTYLSYPHTRDKTPT